MSERDVEQAIAAITDDINDALHYYQHVTLEEYHDILLGARDHVQMLLDAMAEDIKMRDQS